MTEDLTRRTFVKAVSTAVAVGTGLGAASAATPEPSPTSPVTFEAGKNTHENVVFPCSGGFSNVALISSLASLEAVKELGLEKLAVGCLAGLPNNNVPLVSVLARAARKVVTVDGCPNQCARKIVEAAGLKIARSIVVSEDAHVAKHTFRTDVGGNAKPVLEYLRDGDVGRTKKLIIDAINDV